MPYQERQDFEADTQGDLHDEAVQASGRTKFVVIAIAFALAAVAVATGFAMMHSS
jgi:hypothetical protein